MTHGNRILAYFGKMVLLLVFFSTQAAAPALADERLSGILEGIRAYYGNLPGLTVSYERDIVSRSMAMLGQGMKTDLASGLIHFKPPHFLRMQQKMPKPEDVITDGQILWWVIHDRNRVYRYPSHKLGRELKVLGDIFQGLRDVEESFEITLKTYGVEKGHRLELRPNPSWPEVDHIVVTIDPETSLIRSVETHNPLGGRTRFTLGPLTVRDRFGKKFFTFDIPEDMKVIEEEG